MEVSREESCPFGSLYSDCGHKSPKQNFENLFGTSYRHLSEIPSHDFPQKVWDYGKEGYKFRMPNLEKTKQVGIPQREILSPLEASLDHFLITPPSHFMTQKVRGFVDGFFVNEG